MLQAVIVEDEALPALWLEKLLQTQGMDVEIIAIFDDSMKASSQLAELAPDIVFLDIHMPEIDGLSLAAHIQQLLASVEIVFVTGYEQHALQAFELYAIDYLMKPVQLERLQKTVERLQERVDSKRLLAAGYSLKHVYIGCFNKLTVKSEETDDIVIKWRTAKGRELFAYLLHHRHRMVSRSSLLDLLWSDFSPDKGMQQLYTAIYYIRYTLKQLKVTDIIIESGSNVDGYGYQLSLNSMILDCEQWELGLRQLLALSLTLTAQYSTCQQL